MNAGELAPDPGVGVSLPGIPVDTGKLVQDAGVGVKLPGIIIPVNAGDLSPNQG